MLLNANDGRNSAFVGICMLPVNPSKGLYVSVQGGKRISLIWYKTNSIAKRRNVEMHLKIFSLKEESWCPLEKTKIGLIKVCCLLIWKLSGRFNAKHFHSFLWQARAYLLFTKLPLRKAGCSLCTEQSTVFPDGVHISISSP